MTSSVALIEMGNYHDQCLYAQIRFLQARGRRVHLIVSEPLAALLDPRHGADHLEVVAQPPGTLGKFKFVRRIAAYLKGHAIRKAVINTAQGRATRDLTFFAPRGVELIGVLHHAEKLVQWSVTHQIIARRIKKFFVLNDYVLDNLAPYRLRSALASFYPIFFPDRPAPKPREDGLTVVVPGSVVNMRRDYPGLLQAITAESLDPRVRFVLAGNSAGDDGPALRRAVAEAGLTDRFTFFDRYLDYSEMFDRLRRCDLVMPLIHPGADPAAAKQFASYTRFQISSTFLLAFAALRPMLMHRQFEFAADFRANCWFYGAENLVSTLNDLARHPEKCARRTAESAAYPKFQFDYQADRYVDFLERSVREIKAERSEGIRGGRAA